MDLDAATLEKSLKTVERALRGGNHLMRKELKAVLEKSGFDLEGNRVSFIMMNAELCGLVCSGPRRGKQHTYGLLEERRIRVAYKDSRHVIDAAGTARAHDEGFPFTGGVVLDSQVVGTWRSTTTKNEALIRFALYARPNEAQTRALHAAASEYARFLDLPAAVEISLVPAKTG